jgi:CRISPR-associated protein Cas5d
MAVRRRSDTFRVRVRGPLACFTRPEFHVERVSYEVITPSAARGVLSAIHWKPAFDWVVTGIWVLAPVKFIGFKRNEIAARVSTHSVAQWAQGKVATPYFTDHRDSRHQCHTLALRDVDYVIEAHFETTPIGHAGHTVPKHTKTFTHRLEMGRTFHQPYLGCREFAADVEPAPAVFESRLPAEWRNRDLGLMLYDMEFGAAIRPWFYRPRIDGAGRIEVKPPASSPFVAVHLEDSR